MRFKINVPVRFQNPWFWVGLGSVILTAMGVSPEMLTSWPAVGQAIKDLFTNPFLLSTTALAVLGVFVDPTTKNIGDSDKALTYKKPE